MDKTVLAPDRVLPRQSVQGGHCSSVPGRSSRRSGRQSKKVAQMDQSASASGLGEGTFKNVSGKPTLARTEKDSKTSTEMKASNDHRVLEDVSSYNSDHTSIENDGSDYQHRIGGDATLTVLVDQSRLTAEGEVTTRVEPRAHGRVMYNQ